MREGAAAWAEDRRWVGVNRGRRWQPVDPAAGAINRTAASNRCVTGVTWGDGELRHGTWEGDGSEIVKADYKGEEIQLGVKGQNRSELSNNVGAGEKE